MARRQFGDIGRDLRRDMDPGEAEMVEQRDDAGGGGFIRRFRVSAHDPSHKNIFNYPITPASRNAAISGSL